MKKFPCSGCGMCCTKVGLAVTNARLMIGNGDAENLGYVKEVAEFPYNTTPDGACENLMADHSCKVYETRPDICHVDKTWAKHHAESITLVQYQFETAQLCNSLIISADMEDKYLIDLKNIINGDS